VDAPTAGIERVGEMSGLQEQCEDGFPVSHDSSVHSVEVPVQVGKPWRFDEIRQTWLDLLKEVSDAEKATELARDAAEKVYREGIWDEAKLKVFEFRRDVGQLFLFMLRAASSEFPADIFRLFSDCVSESIVIALQEEIRLVRRDNRKLMDEVAAQKKRMEEFVILWNNMSMGESK